MTFCTTAAEPSAPVGLHRFYGSGAWIEGAAELQLDQALARPGVRAVAAFPDLHPGLHGPVGAAILSERLHPALIGGDVGCGMGLFRLDLPARRLKLDKAEAALHALEGPWQGDGPARLEAEGLSPRAYPMALGTIGGGNHFCELQAMDDGALALLVHSGSRALGQAVLNALPESLRFDLDPAAPEAAAWLKAHDEAARWAMLNRRIIAERAAEALRADLELLADAPHNLVAPHAGGWLHRKGAAVAATGALVPLAGSREAPSWLLRAAPDAPAAALASMSHGAGRRYKRSAMHGWQGRNRSELERLRRPATGGRVICADKALLIEEAGAAYKDPRAVLAELVAFGLASPVAELRPLVTFKTALAREDRS